MGATKHLLLWSSLGTLVVLILAAVSENFLQDWKSIQRQIRVRLPEPDAAHFSVQLRQIVATELKATDRCVSCHVGMAAGESGIEGDRIFGKHPDVVHDPAEFGCTVCHGGQGRATTTEEAHGNVEFWPEPMLPKRALFAACGTCHTHLAVPNEAKLEAGRSLFERNDCLACHRMDGRGGTMRPGGSGGQEGPDLSRVGARGFRADWYERHLKLSPFGDLGAEERGSIDEYLKSRVGAPGLPEAKALFHSLGCRGCHKIGGVGGDDGPELTRVGEKDPGQLSFAAVPGERSLSNWFKAHFRSPAAVVPNSAMPELGLAEAQIDQLTFYMLSLRRGNFPEVLWPNDRIRAERFGAREFTSDGATLYGTFCSACHGGRGEGMRYAGTSSFPAIGNPAFLRMVPDDFLREQIRLGRPGRRMPAWEGAGGLRPEEIENLVRFVRNLGGVPFEGDPKPNRWARGDVSEGERIFAQSCALCHGPQGEGKEGPALRNPVLLRLAGDTYLFKTTREGREGTSMPSFRGGSAIQRALTDAEIESVVTFIRAWEEKR